MSNPYLRSIRDYDNWCRTKSEDIATELGFRSSDPLVRFAIFNAYGELTDRDKVRGIPVLMPKNLPEIFGLPVFTAFQELHSVVQSVVIENEVFRRYSQGMSLPKVEPVRADTLEASTNGTPEDRRRLLAVTLDRITYGRVS